MLNLWGKKIFCYCCRAINQIDANVNLDYGFLEEFLLKDPEFQKNEEDEEDEEDEKEEEEVQRLSRLDDNFNRKTFRNTIRRKTSLEHSVHQEQPVLKNMIQPNQKRFSSVSNKKIKNFRFTIKKKIWNNYIKMVISKYKTFYIFLSDAC